MKVVNFSGHVIGTVDDVLDDMFLLDHGDRHDDLRHCVPFMKVASVSDDCIRLKQPIPTTVYTRAH